MKRLLNRRNGALVAGNATWASTMFSRLKGLLGRASFEPGEALILPSCSAVHMFFMRFAIDIVFCDKNFQVLGIQENLRPWRISKLVPNAYYTIELPLGTIQQADIRLGDELERS